MENEARKRNKELATKLNLFGKIKHTRIQQKEDTQKKRNTYKFDFFTGRKKSKDTDEKKRRLKKKDYNRVKHYKQKRTFQNNERKFY